MPRVKVTLQVMQHTAHHPVVNKGALVAILRAQHLAHGHWQKCDMFEPLPGGIMRQVEMQPAEIALTRAVRIADLEGAIIGKINAPDQPAAIAAQGSGCG